MWQLTSRRRGAGTRAAASTALSSMFMSSVQRSPSSMCSPAGTRALQRNSTPCSAARGGVLQYGVDGPVLGVLLGVKAVEHAGELVEPRLQSRAVPALRQEPEGG